MPVYSKRLRSVLAGRRRYKYVPRRGTRLLRAIPRRGGQSAIIRRIPRSVFTKYRFTKMPHQGTRNPKTYAKLVYVGNCSLNTSTATSAEHAFSLNSIYDPDVSGAGHQPYMHDTLATMWKHYIVDYAKVEVIFHADSAHSGLLLYIRADDDASASSTKVRDAMLEAGVLTRYKILSPQPSQAGQMWSTRLKAFFNLKKMRNINDDANFQAAFGSSPSDQVPVIVGHAGNSLNSINVTAHVKITYYCTLRGALQVAQS